MGPLGKALDGVFIDRDDPEAALETMRTVEERAKNGLSILIAPEGTRLDTTEVGPFKKGPFRLAMAAGIPIVPIVIRNAEIVAARNSATINPGTVDVAVFPPIPVTDWTVETLPERIAEVRQLYLDTLANWPRRRAARGRPVRRRRRRPRPGSAVPSRPRRSRREEGPAKKAAAKKARPRRLAAKKPPAKAGPERRQGASKTVKRSSPARTSRQRRADISAQRTHVTQPAADTSAVLTAQDSLVLASMDSRVETQLVMDWLGRQRARNPDAKFDVLKLPPRDAPPTALTALVEQLESGEGPFDRAGAGVLAAARGSRQSRQAGRAAPRPGSLPPQPTSAAPHRAQRSPPGPGGGRRVGQGVRTPPAVARHHRRGEPARFRPVRHRAAPSWRWNAPSTESWGRSTSLRDW